MIRKRLLLVALIAVLTPAASFAGILELRAGAGLNAANPDDFEDRANAVSGQSLDSGDFDNFHADIFFDLPVLPLGIGVRHEWLNNKETSGGQQWEVDAKNLSLLVDWRFIDTVVYFGPIVGIGYPWADVDFSGGADHVSDQIKGDQLSYFGGAEVGVKLGRFLVGAEAGYSSIKLEKTNSDNNNVEADVDLSGFYGKVMVGLSFL